MSFKREYRVDEAALVAVGIKKISRISELDDLLERGQLNQLIDIGNGKQLYCNDQNKYEILFHIKAIIKALKEDVELAMDWGKYNS